MAIIGRTLAAIKCSPVSILGGAVGVNDVFARAGHTWRNRLLDPANTLALFVLQVLHGNTAISHLRHLSGIDFSEGSYCDARKKLPVSAVAEVVEHLCRDSRKGIESAAWRDRRVLLADGTSTLTPDTPVLQEQWPQHSVQKPGCGFPSIKLLGLLDLATGMIVHLTVMCLNTHEMSQLAGPHLGLKAGDVLLADRGFCSFWHLAMLAALSVDAVFRMHQQVIVDFTPNRPHRGKSRKKYKTGMPSSRFVRRLGHEDQIVQWVRPPKRPDWMSEAEFSAIPERLEVRELRYRIIVKGQRTRVVTICTTLLDAVRYPKRDMAELYGLRWEIETNFKHLKTTMGMEHLKCQTVNGVLKEIMVYVLVYNLVRAAMAAAAQRQGVDDANRMSFIDAMRWLCSLLSVQADPASMPDLKVNPKRKGRWCPRVKKKRMKEYDLMNKPRSQYVEPAQPAEVTA